MKLELYTDAVLARDIPEHGLCAGDVVKVVDFHPTHDSEGAYSIEVFNTLGETIAVTSVNALDLEPLLANEVFSVRKLSLAVW
jgi:Domain of unknown function (DUF4926)